MIALKRRLLRQHLAIVAAVLLVADGGLWFLLRRAAQGELLTTLRKEVEKIASLCELEPDLPELEGENLDEARLDHRPIFWHVTLENGTVLAGSPEAERPELRLPALGGPGLRVDTLQTDITVHPRLGRVLVGRLRARKERVNKPNRPVLMPATMVFDVRAAIPTASVDQVSLRLLWALVATYPLLLGLVALAAWRLIGRAVNPVSDAFERERRFTGAASHELRTPLTAMRGELDIVLRRSRSPEEYVEAMVRLRRLAERMSNVVDGLLTLARAQAGHLLLGARAIETGTFVASILDVLRLIPEGGRVAIETSATESRRVLGDPTLLSQAVRILVENALLHGGQTPVTLVIRDEGVWLQIVVEDRGAGFSPEVLASPTAPTDRLGLRIAEAIVAAHGGTLELENAATGGARASIRLPSGKP